MHTELQETSSSKLPQLPLESRDTGNTVRAHSHIHAALLNYVNDYVGVLPTPQHNIYTVQPNVEN